MTEKKEVTIWSHLSPDIDSVFSVLYVDIVLLARSTPRRWKFVPANWNGEGGEQGDWAVDVEAGGHGIKGKVDPDGTVHSCFATLVDEYGDDIDKVALKPLVDFIDAEDSKGSAVKFLAPNLGRDEQTALMSTGLNAVLSALRKVAKPNEDKEEWSRELVVAMTLIFQGMVQNLRARHRTTQEAKTSKRNKWVGREVVVMDNPRSPGMMFQLFEDGARVVIYVDGNNIGLVRHESLSVRMDHPNVQAVVRKYGEKDWFQHSAGFIYSRGTKKAPANDKSKVPPMELAEAIAKVLETLQKYS